jgi:hypothetical protein
MPDLPQSIILPSAEALDMPPTFHTWARQMISAWGWSWNLMVQTLNGLSKVDTEANRPTNPDLDHVFYTANNGEQRTYVGVDGAWQGIRPTLQVVTTANLPAANASRDGATLIEQAGANDHNIIIYAGGNRYRIDGGAAF